jgi:hypothetical protein
MGSWLVTEVRIKLTDDRTRADGAFHPDHHRLQPDQLPVVQRVQPCVELLRDLDDWGLETVRRLDSHVESLFEVLYQGQHDVCVPLVEFLLVK